ncbi:hypothetical protein FCULG_00004310 [Fusarium culmorum]|uniref:Uncharacterized protein n=1 Tax=Fusarium culmorum TaxID=5516 RepID=A0A2T4H9Q4_FUSCU|nr:hypothetical protein FCULG_00004310 [Fusarium culmorum]
MASLPSYQDAVSADWVRLVIPYISPNDFAALCRVNRHFWEIFAPRIWGRLLATGSDRLTGRDSEHDLDWLVGTVLGRLGRTRSETANLVRVLDTRFVRGTCSLSMANKLNASLKNAIRYLPNLNCVLIDGHEDLDPSEFLSEAGRQVQLLSMADCPLSLSTKFISSLQVLVYLDLSRISGSIRPLLQSGTLPELRILKLQGKEVDDAAVENLANCFGTRLWSLDLEDNKLTDAALYHLGTRCMCPADLRSDARYDVEGKLEFGSTSPIFETSIRIIESDWSGSFSHPNRHLADAPSYDVHDTLLQEHLLKRLDGRDRIKCDSANAVCRGLQGEDPYLPPSSFQGFQGLTHLNLSGNQISSLGAVQLLTHCRGHLQSFSCDSMLLIPSSKAIAAAWPKMAKLHGFCAAWTLRPLFSSNLRVVRLHHSIVTRIPTLEIDELSTLARLYVCENSILPRVKDAFPEAFIPDMNPRIESLTLTCIPRRSSGPLIDCLIHFLQLLAAQERAIFDISSRRGPGVLAGLRHFRLEFEPDPHGQDSYLMEDIDAQQLLNSGEAGFSFFENEAKQERPPIVLPANSIYNLLPKDSSSSLNDLDQPEGSHLDIDIWMEGKSTSIRVWIGPRDGKNPVLRHYRNLAVHHRVHDHIGPASPAQVQAGVPSTELVFHTAWCMAIMPHEIKEPSGAELEGMRDVLTELKRFRLEGRAEYLELQKRFGSRTVPPGPPHGFWLGKLEVSTQQVASRRKKQSYWR